MCTSECAIIETITSFVQIYVCNAVGPRLSASRLSEPSIIRTVVVTVLIEYFVNR